MEVRRLMMKDAGTVYELLLSNAVNSFVDCIVVVAIVVFEVVSGRVLDRR
jgi:hypothetical protein